MGTYLVAFGSNESSVHLLVKNRNSLRPCGAYMRQLTDQYEAIV